MYPYNQYPYPIYKPTLLDQVKMSLNNMDLVSTIQTTQKTIYTINQIIPLVQQLKPLIHNASYALKIARTMKSFDFDDIDESISKNITE